MYEQSVAILIIAIILGLDAFSLSMGMGLKGVRREYEIKFIATVGVLHVIMPLAGLALGVAAGRLLGIWAAWLGAVILVCIGVDLLLKGYRAMKPTSYSLRQKKEVLTWFKPVNNNGTLISVVILAISVSIDALTVGFSLGTLEMPLALTALVIGLVAAAMTALGFSGGRYLNRLIGGYAQMIGGVVLIALAAKLVWQ